MAYGREQLIDPSPGGLGSYTFQINHTDEDAFGTARQIDVTANTAGGLAVRQQGDDEPLVLNLTGTILHENQYEKMVAFARKARTQSMVFVDFTGDHYEVLITGFKPQRKRTSRNPRDPSINLHYYGYTLQLHVLKPLSGVWA